MWPFLVFCDPSVFLHDGLWCKVQLLWILPYFVIFVTIMAFMVVQLGLQCISNLFLVIFTPRRGFSAKFGCFGWKVMFSNVAISISAAIPILHCGLQ